MKFHPDEVTFQHDVTTTVDVSALPICDGFAISIKLGNCWIGIEQLAEHVSAETVREIEEMAAELHADAEHERRQHSLFGGAHEHA